MPKELNSNSQQAKDTDLNKPSKTPQRKITDLASIKNEYLALNIPLYAGELIPEKLQDKENGAFYLRQTFEVLKSQDESSAVNKLLALRKKGFEDLSSEEKEQLVELFNDPAILKVLDFQEVASRQEQHNWGLDYKAGFNMVVDHLTPMKRLHIIQELRIKHLLNSDNRDAALKAIKSRLEQPE